METKNLYIGAFIVAVLLAIGVYIWSSKPVASTYKEPKTELPSGAGKIGTSDDSEAYDILITFDGEVYSPREVTITSGQRVRFENLSDTPTWPASAIHPTHSLYPSKEETDCLGSSFDACIGLEQGQTWSYTFYHEGEWRYHDHLDASKTGVINVTP